MKNFILKTISAHDIKTELEKIGFDRSYQEAASDKFQYKNLKIFDLNSAQANIIKQTALSVGADCGTHKDVVSGKIEKSDVILGGSFSQLKKIAKKLSVQPFGLNILAEEIISELEPEQRTTKLAGILNVTPDSFSDGGMYYKPEEAIKHAYQLIDDGADILDIGAESTRPFAEPVPFDIQIERLKPVLNELSNAEIPLSVDTRSSFVAEFAVKNGVKIINDVSGLDYDPRIAEIAAKSGATLILQHSKGTPENMQVSPEYDDVVEEIFFMLKNKVELAKYRGVENIILDVGIGFGKTREHNFELLNRIEEFYPLGYPIMVGLSRKSLLGINSDDNDLKDALSLAISYPLMQKSVDYLRVHNVKLHKQLLTHGFLK